MKSDYLVVHKSVVPENFLAVIETRNLIDSGKYSISEACKKMNISRGTYYKYKDYVFLASSEIGKKAIISFLLDDEKGILSNLLNTIANLGGNILAINQEMPINHTAYVTITVDVIELKDSVDTLLHTLENLKGVRSVKLIAME